MTRLHQVFWAIASADALLLAALAIVTWRAPNPDGGREMALSFYVAVPGVVLVAAMLVHGLVDSAVARGIAWSVVALPALLFVAGQGRDRWIDHRIADHRSGAGWFTDDAMRAMGRAVVGRDVEALRRDGVGVDVDGAGESGMTLMRLAVEPEIGRAVETSEALPVVRALLALGAKPDPALPVAATRDDTTLLRVLLDAGADPARTTDTGEPLVFGWVDAMTPDALRLLLSHGLDPDIRSPLSPLSVHVTIHRRHDLLAVLIAHGVDLKATRSDGRDVAGELAAQGAAAIAMDGAVPPQDREQATLESIPNPSGSAPHASRGGAP